MKANKAPEKIYLEREYSDNGVLPNGLNYIPKPTDIKYTRTDAFIKKFENWIYDKFHWFAEEFNEGIMAEFNDIDTAIEDFKKYMGGE